MNDNFTSKPQFTIHNSQFTIHHSPFIIHHSSFTIHHSPFIIHHQFTIFIPPHQSPSPLLSTLKYRDIMSLVFSPQKSSCGSLRHGANLQYVLFSKNPTS